MFYSEWAMKYRNQPNAITFTITLTPTLAQIPIDLYFNIEYKIQIQWNCIDVSGTVAAITNANNL